MFSTQLHRLNPYVIYACFPFPSAKLLPILHISVSQTQFTTIIQSIHSTMPKFIPKVCYCHIPYLPLCAINLLYLAPLNSFFSYSDLHLPLIIIFLFQFFPNFGSIMQFIAPDFLVHLHIIMHSLPSF